MILTWQRTAVKLLCLLVTLQPITLNANPLTALFNKDKKGEFVVQVTGDSSIRNILKEEIKTQRETNLERKQYTQPSKIARFEKDILHKRLRAEGFYAATVKANYSASPLVYTVNTGAQYIVDLVKIIAPAQTNIPTEIFKLKKNAPLKAQAVLDAKSAVTEYLRLNSCLYQIKVDYRVLVDHETHLADVEIIVAQSPAVTVNSIKVEGLKKLDAEYVRQLIPIEDGKCFQRSQLAKRRLSMLETNLFSSVDTEVSEPISGGSETDEVIITFKFTERSSRTISAGAGFQSDDGLGVSLGWESRSLFTKAQKLEVKTRLYQNTQSISGTLTLPNYRRKNQKVTLFTEVEKEETDAFDSTTSSLGADIERFFTKRTKGRIGLHADFTRLEENGETDDLALLSIPTSLEYDRRDSALDPRKGWAGAVTIEPYWDAYETDTRFLRTIFALSAYTSFEELAWRPTLALRTSFGAIDGVPRTQVPIDLRFFAGGGGSVRGYEFQSIGPRDEDGEPDGGLSYNEVSLEVRTRWGESWGGVAFIDGGAAYETTEPEFGSDLLWGVGLGLRFYTSFAPIRLDVAIPLDKRDDIDDSFQLYISIGQAF